MRICAALPFAPKQNTRQNLSVSIPGNPAAASYRQSYTLAFGVLALAWVVLSFPWLSGEVTIPYDAKAHFQAQVQFLANALHSGQSPFWNPNVFAGSPQIADPQAMIFSPLFLLAWFEAVPSFRELDAMVLALLGAGAIAILMLFRDRGWHPGGGVVAALALAFGASAAWRVQHILQVQSFAFFAIAFWLLARALDRRSLWYGLAAGVFLGLMLAGPGQVTLLNCYILAGYVVHHWLSAPNRRAAVVATLGPLVVAGTTCLLLAGGPILLTMLFVESSNRPEIIFAEAVRGSLHPALLATALVPGLYGTTDPSVPFWGPPSPGWPADALSLSENMGQLYVGALPVIVIFAAGLTRGALWGREARFFTAALAVLVIYALGRYTPLFKLFFDLLPGVDMFRRPADATFQIGAMMAILAGYAVHRHLTAPAGAIPFWRRALPPGLLGAAFVMAAGIALYHGQLAAAAKPIAIALAFTLAAFALMAVLARLGRENWQLATAALALFMTADLAVNNGPNNSTGRPPADYDILLPASKNDTISFLKTPLRQQPGSVRRDLVEMVGIGFEWPNASLVHGFDHALGYNPLRLAEMSAAGAGEGVAEVNQRHFTPLYPSYRSTMADLLGVRYIASQVPINRIDGKIGPGDLRLVTRTSDAYIYENPRALPRVLFAGGWQNANFARITKDGSWPRFDPTKTVLLDGYAGPVLHGGAGATSLRMRRYENTVVEVEVDTPNAGFIVLNDVYHPWWFATVDGKPAEILRANVLFRAVRVAAGRHVVRFEFAPVTGAMAELSGVLTR